MDTGKRAQSAVRRWRDGLLVGVALAVIVGGCTVYAAHTGQPDRVDEKPVAVRRACGGLLPYDEVKAVVPDGMEGSVDARGTMVDSRGEDRLLLRCAISAGDDVRLWTKAQALLGGVPEKVEPHDLADGESFAAPGITGLADQDGGVWVLASCPGGLAGRVRSSEDLYVTASASDERSIQARALANFRVAALVANRIRAVQKCGGPDVVVPGRVVKGSASDSARCSWITRGVWEIEGDAMNSPMTSACLAWRDTGSSGGEGAQRDQVDKVDRITGFRVASWSGALGLTAVEGDGYTGTARILRGGQVGAGASPSPWPSLTPRPYDYGDSDQERPSLLVWAVSRCGGRRTYHEVEISDDNGKDADVIRAGDDIMRRYLSDSRAWPTAVGHCRDTRVLGREWSR